MGLSARFASDAPQAIRPQWPLGAIGLSGACSVCSRRRVVRMTNFLWNRPTRAPAGTGGSGGAGARWSWCVHGLVECWHHTHSRSAFVEQSEVVEQLTTKAEFVPVLRQQLAGVEALNRPSGISNWIVCWTWWRERHELQTFLAELNDWAVPQRRHHHHQAWGSETVWRHRLHSRPGSAPAAGGGDRARVSGDPLLNRIWRNVRLLSR